MKTAFCIHEQLSQAAVKISICCCAELIASCTSIGGFKRGSVCCRYYALKAWSHHGFSSRRCRFSQSRRLVMQVSCLSLPRPESKIIRWLWGREDLCEPNSRSNQTSCCKETNCLDISKMQVAWHFGEWRIRGGGAGLWKWTRLRKRRKKKGQPPMSVWAVWLCYAMQSQRRTIALTIVIFEE